MKKIFPIYLGFKKTVLKFKGLYKAEKSLSIVKNKNIFFGLALAILLLGSCANKVVDHKKKNRTGKFSHSRKDNHKQISAKKTPSDELAQIGLKDKKYVLVNSEEAKSQEFADKSLNDQQEITDSFLSEDGTYIGKYKVGNSYQISGVTYQPEKYDNFEEVGMASWYGDDFHGRKTANGEIYHKGDMTAAHPTLPLPSMVRITNLDNGKSVKVRVNDRGPFSKKRITDVSQKAAEELGFKNKGTAKVKLEFLKEDTEEMLQKLGIEETNAK